MRELTNIQVDELANAEQKQIAELIGLENYAKLVEAFGGRSIYIQKPDGFYRIARNEEIRREYTGSNYKELAAKYSLTDVTIRQIVAEETQKIKKSPMDGQESFL